MGFPYPSFFNFHWRTWSEALISLFKWNIYPCNHWNWSGFRWWWSHLINKYLRENLKCWRILSLFLLQKKWKWSFFFFSKDKSEKLRRRRTKGEERFYTFWRKGEKNLWVIVLWERQSLKFGSCMLKH